MDKTETYIKMADCEEIQGLRTIAIKYGGDWVGKWDVEGHTSSTRPKDVPDSFQDGDFIVLDGEVHVIGTTIYRPERWVYPDKTDRSELPLVGYDEGDGKIFTSLVWLPLQDQLQEMVIQPMQTIIDLVINITRFGATAYPKRCAWDSFSSMEQLWLAFVMKEKHNKTWNGEEWRCRNGKA